MEQFMMMTFMGIIGAIIGGVTNYLAIKMLFRPHKPIYFGKWRLPFTPGLIPKRRHEVARQMGLLVVNHLLTAEGIQKKLQEEQLMQDISNWLAQKVHMFFQSDTSLEILLKKAGIGNIGEQLDDKFFQFIYKKFDHWLQHNGHLQLKDVVPSAFWIGIEFKVPVLTDYLIEKIKGYLQSEKGRDFLKAQIDRFFEGKGKFFCMLQSFLEHRHIVNRLEQEIIKIIENK